MTEGLMPEPTFRAATISSPMDELVMRAGEPPRWAAQYDEDAPWLLGTRIPPFQRPRVWSEAQSIRFVESAWMGLALSSYCVNRCDRVSGPGKDRFHRTDRWLIDGQQRLNAIADYLADRFPVFGHLWSGLTELDRRRFGSITFAQARTNLSDEADLRVLYDRLNFSGTAHLESERASPRR